MVTLISVTGSLSDVVNGPEALVAYCARVSSPKQENPEIAGLLRYCIKHKHWSPFEMVDMTVEIKTTRAISAQILRHRSFHFQEFSQRYAQVQKMQLIEARRQDEKNRQNSVDDLDQQTKMWFLTSQKVHNQQAIDLYETALSMGIAKECARFFLPMSAETTLYMKGTLRDWLAYLNVRLEVGVQLEHRLIAEDIRDIVVREFPVIAEACGGLDDGGFM